MSDTEQAALTLDIDGDGVAWLVFDQPNSKVNLLTTAIMSRLDALLDDVEAAIDDGRIRAVVVRSGKDGTFIAGADVDEIAGITDPVKAAAGSREGQRIFRRLDRLHVPTLAAIDGTCLGGGTEMALACDGRLASDRPSTKIGMPEVRLGIIPGFGGTVRLPRVIGLMAASDLILTGRTVDARKARRIGLVHESVPPSLLYERARELVLQWVDNGVPAARHAGALQKLAEGTRAGRRLVLWQAKRQTLKQTQGNYPAPLVAIRVMRRTASMSLDRALDVEAESVGELIASPICKNLIHVFHLMEGAKKTGPDAAPVAVERVAVLGAGTMGGGIAQLLAYNDLGVRLKDIRPEALSDGLRHARSLFDKSVQRRRMRRREADRKMDLVAPTLDYSGFRNVEFVIEAVVERMDVKKQVLRETEDQLHDGAVMASNTSALSITEMQSALARPERFCGMHFFNPVHRMPLIEVIRGEHTSDESVATVLAVARRMGKTPVLVQDGPGFLVNRLLGPYLNEAGWLLGDGVSIEAVDGALTGFGMPMGPFRLLDEVGLDVVGHVAKILHDGFGERMQPSPALAAIQGTGRLGKKGGLGFYQYENGKEKGPDEGIYTALGDAVPADRSEMPAERITDRCVLIMVNEAARLLDDGIAASPGDVDLAMITGTGFPPFRGGLLRYADAAGLASVLARLLEFRDRFGARFEPAPRILRYAEEGRGFYG
jgi:3-hydroxyacyl-CoA dehydrogenase/enoyl-CoA hydratase/3-hydroxybutyryl-CoA epimerase